MRILEDIRVLDLTQFWFGPYCTMMLADMGAEVIRVEPPWGSVDRLADAYIIGGRIMERLGLGYDVLKELNPRIIYAALSGFGQTGPYTARPSFAPIAEAMSGHSRLTGDGVDVNGPPIEMAQAVGDLAPGLYAAMSIIAAVRHRDRKGEGQMIDVAQLDVMTSMNMALTGYNLSGSIRPYGFQLSLCCSGWLGY